MIVDGTGVNFKAGIVYRPTANLRLGAAIHTPTYYSLDRKFQSAAAGLAYANNDTDPNVKPDKDGYISTANDPNMTSPLLVVRLADAADVRRIVHVRRAGRDFGRLRARLV